MIYVGLYFDMAVLFQLCYPAYYSLSNNFMYFHFYCKACHMGQDRYPSKPKDVYSVTNIIQPD